MRICVITSGHLATCPRMVKAARALTEAGHDTRLVSAQFLDWAADADRSLGATRWTTVDYRRSTSPAKYWATGIQFHAARKWVRIAGSTRSSPALLAAAHARASRDLLKLALAEPADLFYGGTCGGLAIAAIAARRAGAPYALDLEDFHEGEFHNAPEWNHSREILRSLLQQILPESAFVTAGSSAMAERYQRDYDVPVLPIHNTFSLPTQAPDPEPQSTGALKLYWFSQTVGDGRGLEDVVRAVGLAEIRAELHLRGATQSDYVASLRGLAHETNAQLAVRVHAPALPEQMVDLSRPYDIGLSPEQGRDVNRDLCLGNKALTYILAGLPVVLTDTAGQRPLAVDLGDGALKYRPGDIASLAAGLRRWAQDRGCLRRARQAAWEAANHRWHWDHPSEKGALLRAVMQ